MADESTIHRGLDGVVVDSTRISKVMPEINSLVYFGYPVQELAEHCCFEEVAWLLWHGELPNAQQLTAFQTDGRSRRHLSKELLSVIQQTPRTAHGVDIVPQGAEIHIRALLDTRDGTLRDVQHFGHIGLRELPGAAKFFQRHSLKLVAHQLPVIRDGRRIHFRLQFPVVTCHTVTLHPPTLAGAGHRWHRRAVHTPHTSDCCPFYRRQSVAWQPGARRTHREPDTAAPHAECANSRMCAWRDVSTPDE